MPHSGKDGKVFVSTVAGVIPAVTTTELCDIRNWSFAKTADVKAYRSSCSGSGTKRVFAHTDVTGGKVEVYADDTAVPTVVEGTKYVFKLMETATKGWWVPVIVTEITFNTDIEGGDVVSYTINFDGDGSAVAIPGTP